MILTSIILHSDRIAFARYKISLPTAISFMMLLVTMMTSSAVFAISLMTKYTICRSDASLFWNNFEIPKKRDVASLVGNLSPVKRRRAILVSSLRHLKGDMGDELKSRARKTTQRQRCRRYLAHLPSWKTEVLSTLRIACSASSSFFPKLMISLSLDALKPSA